MENADNSTRCPWCGTDPLYTAYHDHEWGRPERDPRRLFELLILESFQAGLSWITILRKRDGFRAAFQGFDPAVIATWGESEVARLLQDPGIVRHRGKIEAAINNAQRARELLAESGTLAAYFWRYEGQAVPGFRATSPESIALSKDLKKRGWRFVGPTTVYAFMQAMGLVNDHDPGCAIHAEVAHARAAFQPPNVA